MAQSGGVSHFGDKSSHACPEFFTQEWLRKQHLKTKLSKFSGGGHLSEFAVHARRVWLISHTLYYTVTPPLHARGNQRKMFVPESWKNSFLKEFPKVHAGKILSVPDRKV